MKYWMTGEVHRDVSDKFRLIRNEFQTKISNYLDPKDYGSGVNEWYYFATILPEGALKPELFPEIKKYIRSKREVDIRLRVDFDSFAKADDTEARRLIAESILLSIDIGKKELNIPNFDFESYRDDIRSFCKSEGWLVS